MYVVPSKATEDLAVADETAIKHRSLIAACLAHAVHDGFTDSLYAFLPVWQTQFGLSYAALAMVRALYYATMGGLQIPTDRALKRFSPRTTLMLSTATASAGLLIAVIPLGFFGLCVGLVIAGIGSSVQHPRGSMLVTDTYGDAARRPLGVYNFSGDLGKAILPALIAAMLPIIAWRPVLALLVILGALVTFALVWLAHATPVKLSNKRQGSQAKASNGFGILTIIGGLDKATRMGYLLFLPFLVRGHGGGSTEVGVALGFLFVGGALGKATCGWLAERFGVVFSVIVTEALTAFMIAATLFTPITATLVILPVLGIVLNGTSSILYGSVPELSSGDTGRAFAIFYTSVIGSGGLAPIAYGLIADHTSQTVGIVASAATAGLIVPLMLVLRPHLPKVAEAPTGDAIKSTSV